MAQCQGHLKVTMSRSFEGHNVAYQCKGPDLSNEVNPLNNDKVITEIQTFNAKW